MSTEKTAHGRGQIRQLGQLSLRHEGERLHIFLSPLRKIDPTLALCLARVQVNPRRILCGDEFLNNVLPLSYSKISL